MDDFTLVGIRPAAAPVSAKKAPWYRGQPLVSLAVLAAIVLGLVLLIRLRLTTPLTDSTMATAMVSPSARPSPSIEALTMPERP